MSAFIVSHDHIDAIARSLESRMPAAIFHPRHATIDGPDLGRDGRTIP